MAATGQAAALSGGGGAENPRPLGSKYRSTNGMESVECSG